MKGDDKEYGAWRRPERGFFRGWRTTEGPGRRQRGAVLPVIVLLAVCLTVVACGGSGASGSDGAAADSGGASFDTINEGQLIVGSDIPYKPFIFGDAPYEGFEADVMDEIEKRLGTEVVFQKTSFDTIFRDLAQGKFDMVVSSVTITPERRKVVDFSEPYFDADLSLMVKKGGGVENVDQLGDKIVGVQLGGTGEVYTKDKLEVGEIRTYDLIDDAFNALQAGQVDAVVNDFPNSKYAERANPSLRVVQALETGDQYGMVFPKGSTGLREAVDAELEKIKEDGTYAELYREWFEVDPPKSFLE